MSGIAGIMTSDQSEPAESDLLKLSDLLAFRGVVDTGIATKQDSGLIYRSSRVQNQSQSTEDSYQPLSSPANLSVVCDGWFSNRAKLTAEFSSKYEFETPCSSELLFPLYEAYGAEFSQYLKGAYALAFYDGHANDLILSCDPSGIKSLYYLWHNGNFMFASSPSALYQFKIDQDESLRSGTEAVGRKGGSDVSDRELIEAMNENEDGIQLHPQALKETLQYGMAISTKTLFKGIQRVLPGQTIIVHQGKITKTFQQTIQNSISSSKESLDSTKKRIKDQLKSLTEARMSSLGKVGLGLSGPGDFLIYPMIKDVSKTPVEIVQVEIPDLFKESSKIGGSESTSMPVGTSVSSSTIVELDESRFWRELPFFVHALEEPIFNPAYIFDYLASKALSQSSQSVISGLGAKFLFADKQRFKRAKTYPLFGGRLVPKKGHFYGVSDVPVFLGGWATDLKSIEEKISNYSKLSRIQKSQLIYFETKFGLSAPRTIENLYTRTGRESHFLFLDHDFMKSCLAVCDSLKINHGRTGYILHDLLRDEYDGQCSGKKTSEFMGFDLNIPLTEYHSVSGYIRARLEVLDSWLINKSSRLGTLVSHQPEIEALFSGDFIRTIFRCKTKHHIRCAWILLLFALWHQSKIRNINPIPDTLSFLSMK